MDYCKKIFLCLLIISGHHLKAIDTTLLIKIPTRSRPDQLFKILHTYYEHLSHTIPYKFLITCDSDDKTMNNPETIKRLKKYPNLLFSFNNNKSKVEAYNRDVNNFTFDILLVAADDVVPVVKDFDVIIFNIMKEAFPDFDGILNINDGTIGRLCNTIPILGGKYYKRFGYVYHPAYKALVCDVELTNVSKILKREKVVDQLLMKHNHPAWGLAFTDDLYKKNETYHMQDKDVFFKRRVTFFDLSPSEIERATPKLWSILICTTEEKQTSFNALYEKLATQIYDLNAQDYVEILYYKDKCGEHTLGHKRNVLLEQSNGKYVSFINEDDTVHDKYVEMVANKLYSDPDCVILNGMMISNGADTRQFIHSAQYKRHSKNNGTEYRPASHLNPIKRSIAAQFTFPEVNGDNDAEWSLRLTESALLHTEEIIEDPYYFCINAQDKR